MAYELKNGEEIRDGVLFGWTGRNCSKCNGTGERDDPEFGWRTCPECAGTGEEWARMPVQPVNI